MAKELVVLLLAFSLIICEVLSATYSVTPSDVSEPDKGYAELINGDMEVVMALDQFPIHVKEGDSLTVSEDGSTSVGIMSGGKMILFGIAINANIAGVNDFDDIPGIGSKTAAKIVALRESRGGFSYIEDLLEVRGLGPKTFGEIRQYLTL